VNVNTKEKLAFVVFFFEKNEKKKKEKKKKKRGKRGKSESINFEISILRSADVSSNQS